MVLLSGDVYLKEIREMTWREKDDAIQVLRERIVQYEEEKRNMKSLMSSLEYAYDRMKTMYTSQCDSLIQLKDENLSLRNELNYLSYKLQHNGDLVEEEIEPIQNITTPNNPISSFFPSALPQQQIQPQPQSFDSTGENSSTLPQVKKRALSRQFSSHSITSNAGSINLRNLELRKMPDTGEEEPVEQITLAQDKQKISRKESAPLIPMGVVHGSTSIGDKPKNHKVNMGDLLFENFVLIGPSLEEIHGTCPIGEGGINSRDYRGSSPSLRASDGTNLMNQNNAQGSGLGGNGTDQADKQIFSQSILIELVKGRLDESQREVVSRHAFPFKVKCRKYQVKQYDGFVKDVYKTLFTENKVKDLRQFVFTIEGEQIILPKGAPKPKFPVVLEGSNPNKRQYCMYFSWDDFVFSNKEKNTLYKCPFAFCFITYYPFFTFFREVFCHIISKIQKERIPQFHTHTKISSPPFLQLDATWIINEFEKELSTYSKKLFELQLIKPEIQKIIVFNVEDDYNLDSSPSPHYSSNATESITSSQILKEYGGNNNGGTLGGRALDLLEQQQDYTAKVSFMVPSYRQLRLLETSLHSGSLLILQLLTYDDFWFILTLCMLEQQIVFFSSNILYVASAIQTFASLFKPFNQSMLIFHIFEGRMTLLETPPPFIGGINQGSEFILANQVITADSVRVNFIDLDSRCFYLSQETIQLFQQSQAFMNYDKYSYEMRKAYSIITHSQYKLQQNFEFRDHQQSKQFNQIMYRSPPLAIAPVINQIASQNQIPILNKQKTNAQSSSHLFGKPDPFSKKSNDYSRSLVHFNTLQDSQSEEAQRVLECQRAHYSAYVKDMKLRAMEEIHDLIESTYQYYIINNLPHEVSIDVRSKFFQVSEFFERILKKCEEKHFTSLFLNTQNFQYFFQQYYETIQDQKPKTASTHPPNSHPTTAQSDNIQRR